MIIKAFRDKMFPPKNPANYPDYVSEKDKLTSSSELSRSSSDLSTSSSPKDAIADSSKSSPDLSESISPRSSLDLFRRSSPINNENTDPRIIRQYFGFISLNEIDNFLNKDSADKGLNASIIDQALNGLKIDIRKLSREGKQTTQLKLLASSIDRIFNDAINKQQGQELKILTPQ